MVLVSDNNKWLKYWY